MKMNRSLTPMQRTVWLNVQARYPGFTEEVSALFWDLLDRKRLDVGDAKFARLLLAELPDGLDVRDLAGSAAASEAALSREEGRISDWAAAVLKSHEVVEAILEGESLIPFGGRDGWLVLNQAADIKQEISHLKREIETLNSKLEMYKLNIEELKPRRVSSIYRLINGIAVGEFEYDSNLAKNKSTSKILNALEKAGVPLSRDTILSVLEEAARFVEENEKL